ncbi:MAG: hypothetical protein ACYCT9_00510 [Leptospirillum sp.]|jgi:hypothetical protein
MKKKISFSILSLIALSSCSTQAVTLHSQRVENGSPGWVSDPGAYEKSHKNEKIFVGISTVNDPEIARTDAKFNALASLADRVKTEIHHLYVSGSSRDSAGDNSSSEKDIENGILGVSKATVSGAHVDKYRTVLTWNSVPGMKIINVTRSTYALVILSDADYRKAVIDTLSGIKKEVKDPHAREVVEEMKKRFLGKTN